MKKSLSTALLFLALFVFFLSCSKSSSEPADQEKGVEIFNAVDRPVFEHDVNKDFMLLKPWNYDKDFNANRLYPLVVALHGGGGSHYAPCIVGNDEEMQKYPCFFFSPTCSNWGGAAAWVRDRIEALKQEYRIDPDRIYLMGFSMGGSGSYSFARAYYSEHGELFAGIVRLAGQSQTTLPDTIADYTSIWYHIGLDDVAKRVEVAEEAFQFIKNYPGNASAVETIVTDKVGTHARTTKTLTKDSIEIMKKSEYTGMGHDAAVPFQDPAVLQWLFSQSLANR